MTKTLVGAAEPERRRNEPVTWTTNTTASTGGNVRIDWIRLDTRQ